MRKNGLYTWENKQKAVNRKCLEETQTLDLLANIHKSLILNMFKELKEICLKN